MQAWMKNPVFDCRFEFSNFTDSVTGKFRCHIRTQQVIWPQKTLVSKNVSGFAQP